MHRRIGYQDSEIWIIEWHEPSLLRHAIDEHEVVLGTEGRGELIHDATRHMREVVFGFLAEQCFFAGANFHVEKAFDKCGGGTLQGGG